jgi:two-component system, NarL family, invasion response regulator UvrY
MKKNPIQIAVIEDHVLMRKALLNFIRSFANYEILFDAGNGREMVDQLQKNKLPDIILMDINMPLMNGYESMAWLQKHHPQVKVLVLSMYSNDSCVIKMLRLGAKGYITKNAEPEELKLALDSVYKQNFYLSDYISEAVIDGLRKKDDLPAPAVLLARKEREVLELLCSELTYREIAAKMAISMSTFEACKNSLFEKLQVKTRTGLALYAMKNELLLV